MLKAYKTNLWLDPVLEWLRLLSRWEKTLQCLYFQRCSINVRIDVCNNFHRPPYEMDGKEKKAIRRIGGIILGLMDCCFSGLPIWLAVKLMAVVRPRSFV